MSTGELKDLLDSLVKEHERDFTVIFSPRKTRRILGSYNARLRKMNLYENSLREQIALVETGLHELAHHVALLRNASDLWTTWKETCRYPSHGRIFGVTLNQLVEAFNSRYSEQFQGAMFCYPRALRHEPHFWPFFEDIRTPEALIPFVNLFNAIFHAPKRCSRSMVAQPEKTSGQFE